MAELPQHFSSLTIAPGPLTFKLADVTESLFTFKAEGTIIKRNEPVASTFVSESNENATNNDTLSQFVFKADGMVKKDDSVAAKPQKDDADPTANIDLPVCLSAGTFSMGDARLKKPSTATTKRKPRHMATPRHTAMPRHTGIKFCVPSTSNTPLVYSSMYDTVGPQEDKKWSGIPYKEQYASNTSEQRVSEAPPTGGLPPALLKLLEDAGAPSPDTSEETRETKLEEKATERIVSPPDDKFDDMTIAQVHQKYLPTAQSDLSINDIDRLYSYEGDYCSEVHQVNFGVRRKDSLLHMAAEKGDVREVRYLVQLGANVDVVNCCGRTPLMVGVKHLPVAKFLIESGANVNLQDKQGYTTLMLAYQCFSKSVADYIMSASNCDYTLFNRYGYSAIHFMMLHSVDDIPEEVLSITCEDSGLLTYAGKPFCSVRLSGMNSCHSDYDVSSVVLTRLSSDVRFAFSILAILDAIEKSNINWFSNSEKLERKFLELIQKEGIDFVRDKKLIPSHVTLELISTEDFPFLFCEMVKKVAGYGGYDTIHSVLVVAKLCNSAGRDFEEVSSLLVSASEMLLYRVQNNMPYSTSIMLINDTFDVGFKFLERLTMYMIAKVKFCLISFFTNLTHCLKDIFESMQGQHSHPYFVKGMVVYPQTSVIMLLSNIVQFLSELFRKKLKDIPEIVALGEYIFSSLAVVVLPDIPAITSVFHSFIATHGDKVNQVAKVLEWGGADWINKLGLVNYICPSEGGLYPLHIAMSGARRVASITGSSSEYCYPARLVSLLLDHGAHPDCLSSAWKTPIEMVQQDNPKYKILRSHYPLPLMCLSATSIIKYDMPYTNIDLPNHIKQFIQFHNSSTYKLLLDAEFD